MTTNTEIVRLDEGGINARILAKQAKADFRRVEGASLKIPARFVSAEGKRMFVRMFNTLQLNDYFISVIAPTRLDEEDMAKIEDALRARLDKVAEDLDRALDEAEALFKANGIAWGATFDSMPLDMQVAVLSSNGRRYLEVLVKMDQMMPLLQTLQILDVARTRAVRAQRAAIKREVRNLANAARNFAAGVRRRMNEMDLAAKRAANASASPRPRLDSEGSDAAGDVAGSEDRALLASGEPPLLESATSNPARNGGVSPAPSSAWVVGPSLDDYREDPDSAASALDPSSVEAPTASQSTPAL